MYIYYVYINTHTCMYIFVKNMLLLYILNIFIYINYMIIVTVTSWTALHFPASLLPLTYTPSIFTHTWPPSGNPSYLLLLIKLSIRLHSIHKLIVWSRGYKLIVCFFAHLLDPRNAEDVFHSLILLRGKDKDCLFLSFWSFVGLWVLHLPFEVVFNLLNKEAFTLLILVCLSIQCATEVQTKPPT